jgi:hypothetical protein
VAEGTREERLAKVIESKGTDRIQIINMLAATCVAILSVLLGLSLEEFSAWIIVQLALATPLLVTASLAYAKLRYREIREYLVWDSLGWITFSLGYTMTLNALAIMLYTTGYASACWWFIGTTVHLHVIYSVLDIAAGNHRLVEKAWKLAIYLVLIFAGAVLPILMRWV